MIKLSLHNSSNNNDAIAIASAMSDPTASTQHRSLWIGSAHSKGSTGSSSSTVRTRSFPLTYGSLHELLSPKSRRGLQYATMDSDSSNSSDDNDDDNDSGKLPSLRSIPDLSDAKACPLSHCYHEHKALNESLNTLATEDTSQSETDDYDGFAPSYQHYQFSPIPRKKYAAAAAAGIDSPSTPSAYSPRRQESLPRLMINTRNKSRGTIWVHSPDCESPHLELSVPLLCGPRKTVGTVSPPSTPPLGVSPRRHTRWVTPTDRSTPLPMTAITAVKDEEPTGDPPGSHGGGSSSSQCGSGPSLAGALSRVCTPLTPDRRRTTTRRRASIHHSRRASSPRRSPRIRSSSIGHGAAVRNCPGSPTFRGGCRPSIENLVIESA